MVKPWTFQSQLRKDELPVPPSLCNLPTKSLSLQRAWVHKEPELPHIRLLRIICYSVHQSPDPLDWNRIKQKLSKNEQFSFDYTYDNHPHQKKTFTSTVHISFHREWISALLQLRHHVTDSIPYKSECCLLFYPMHQNALVLVAVVHIPVPWSIYQLPLCVQNVLSLAKFLVKSEVKNKTIADLD